MSTFRFPILHVLCSYSPIVSHLCLCFSEDARIRKLLGSNRFRKMPKELSREKDRSESLALTMKNGTLLFFAWYICSGQSSLSTQMARSGCILDHARDENGNQSRGKGPKARISFACFFSAIFWPVLVVPLNTISIFGSAINAWSRVFIEESSPTLTACIQILFLLEFLGSKVGQQPSL